MCAHWRAKVGEEQRLIEVIQEMTPPSRSEPGNLLYQAYRSLEDPRDFLLYERYVDGTAFQRHKCSDHYNRLVDGEVFVNLLEHHSADFY